MSFLKRNLTTCRLASDIFLQIPTLPLKKPYRALLQNIKAKVSPSVAAEYTDQKTD